MQNAHDCFSLQSVGRECALDAAEPGMTVVLRS